MRLATNYCVGLVVLLVSSIVFTTINDMLIEIKYDNLSNNLNCFFSNTTISKLCTT